MVNKSLKPYTYHAHTHHESVVQGTVHFVQHKLIGTSQDHRRSAGISRATNKHKLLVAKGFLGNLRCAAERAGLHGLAAIEIGKVREDCGASGSGNPP